MATPDAAARTLDFWFDYSCPYAYLGSTRIEAVAQRTSARLTFCPMLLGGVFRAVGTPQNLSNVLHPRKAQHNANDMHRWAELFGVPLVMPSGHPFRTVEALRATLLCGIDPQVVHGFFRAYWVRGEPPSERATLTRVLEDAGFDAPRVLAGIDAAAVKDDLRARTERAIGLGIFGAPAMIVDGQHLFWGQDRLEFVERALLG